MSLVTKPFEGKAFFSAIRTEMTMNRGMFAGKDGDLCYACMDASFYRLTIFKKAAAISFTAAAMAAPGRVIANGQWFSTNYCIDNPCSDRPWLGEIIVNGVKDAPSPSDFGGFYWYFGQLLGHSQQAYAIGTGVPSTLPAGKQLQNGLYPVNALVVANKRVALGPWETWPSRYGKVVYGIHRASDTVFVLAQEHSLIPGVGISGPALAARLIALGVDDAVLGDGSDSATLVIDGVVEVDPRWYKDNTMRVGPMFFLQTLQTETSLSTLIATTASTEPKFPVGTLLNSIEAELKQTNSGIELTILSFGTSSSSALDQATIFATLGGAVALNSASSRLTVSVAGLPLQFAGGQTLASIVFKPEKDSGGRIVGTITVNTLAGKKAVFDVDWTLI